MTTRLTRRALLGAATGAAAAAGTTIIVRPTRAADYKFVQYHNQSETSTLHKNLVAMWAAIRAETDHLGWSFVIHRTDRPASELLLRLHTQMGAGPNGTGINRWHGAPQPARQA